MTHVSVSFLLLWLCVCSELSSWSRDTPNPVGVGASSSIFCSGTVSPHPVSERQLGACLVVCKSMELSPVLSLLYARALRTPQFFPRTGI